MVTRIIIAGACRRGLLNGNAGGKWNPGGQLTQAQAVQVTRNSSEWLSGPAVRLEGRVPASAVTQDTEAHRDIQKEIERIAARYGPDSGRWTSRFTSISTAPCP